LATGSAVDASPGLSGPCACLSSAGARRSPSASPSASAPSEFLERSASIARSGACAGTSARAIPSASCGSRPSPGGACSGSGCASAHASS
jgi:hypothetical protein